jgi:hypothetical protein
MSELPSPTTEIVCELLLYMYCAFAKKRWVVLKSISTPPFSRR